MAFIVGLGLGRCEPWGYDMGGVGEGLPDGGVGSFFSKKQR